MGTNHLGTAPSAYLRSAAHQPVHWHAWGPAPFALATETDKPVLLDIGAVWCHWCHVMDAESYDDPALAGYLNEHFVCVKVDRDERPDVDARYQRAVQAISRQGGWPLTGFLTPGAELFFGGTYFPTQSLHGRPSFREILERVVAVWRGERGNVLAQAQALRATLAEHLDDAQPGEVSDPVLADAAHRILATADRLHGGFGIRPKFPHPSTVEYLLHRWCDAPEPTLRSVIHETMDGMANGGFRDLLGGGFHRYSVDERWIIPHFEKMSSDNAELLRVYADAGALFGRTAWLDAARDTVRWIREVLAHPDGGFGASQDADTGPGDDGDYFTWSAAELEAALSADELALATAHFGIGTYGSMPHAPERNVLFVATPAPLLAERLGRVPAEVASALKGIYQKLAGERIKRVTPFVDRTEYTGWNAMLVAALLRAGAILEDPDSLTAALRALRRLRAGQPGADAVTHSTGGLQGLLDDPVQCAAAAIDAFETTGADEWLVWAEALMDRVWREHWDAERGGFRDIARGRGGEGLLDTTAKPIQDSPNASPNGVAGITLARLFEHTRAPRWRERHQALVTAFGAAASELGLFASAFLLAADWLVHAATHLMVTGPLDVALAAELHRRALAAFVPRRVVVRLAPDTPTDRLPAALRGFAGAAGSVRAIACTGDRCLAPSSDPDEWSARLRSLIPAAAATG